MFSFINTAYAMSPQGKGGEGPNPMVTIGFFVLMIGIFYFFMIRPQQKKEKSRQSMLSELKKGDKVVTGGGMYGKVIGVTDKKVVLQIADKVKVEFSRNAIAGKVQADGEAVDTK